MPRSSTVADSDRGRSSLSILKLLAHRRPAALIGALALAGCASSQHRFQQEASAPPPEPAALPTVRPAFQPREIAGRWGFAAYHKEGDRVRLNAPL
jgi:hypothetical protein